MGRTQRKPSLDRKEGRTSENRGLHRHNSFSRQLTTNSHVMVAVWMSNWTGSDSRNDASMVLRGQSSSPSSASV